MGNLMVSSGQKTVVHNNEVEVQEINKVVLGKLIVKHVGNEGSNDDKREEVLRQMLQRVITELEREKPEVWRNAELVIYDMYGNDYTVRAGQAENKFVVHLDGQDEIRLTCTDRSSKGFFGWLRGGSKPKPKPIEASKQ
ncbi:Hypp3029 [Branchiostoma lanceolatum]|uniref:Hypp3029 protein n=1 Tax=Branchiostoma lanceolatum TaxID=7740 RepID=A0A8J9ZYR9_BRALA|nr:Hypp3029 [Branchiostoma lanceolatum]